MQCPAPKVGGALFAVQACPDRAKGERHGYKFYCVLARSGYTFDRSREFIAGYKFGGGHWRSVAPKALTEAKGERHGVQIVSEPEICHGAGL